MDSILDTHAPLKIVNKCKLKFKTKPWIIPALQKSISIKTNLLKKFITAKDPQIKEKYRKEYIKTTETWYLQFWSKTKLATTIITLNPTETALKIQGKA